MDRPAPDDADTHPPLPLAQREPIQAATYYGEATSLDVASPVTLHAGEHREGLDIKLRKAATYCVDGKVDPAGAGAGLAIREEALNGADLTRIRNLSRRGRRLSRLRLDSGPMLDRLQRFRQHRFRH